MADIAASDSEAISRPPRAQVHLAVVPFERLAEHQPRHFPLAGPGRAGDGGDRDRKIAGHGLIQEVIVVVNKWHQDIALPAKEDLVASRVKADRAGVSVLTDA